AVRGALPRGTRAHRGGGAARAVRLDGAAQARAGGGAGDGARAQGSGARGLRLGPHVRRAGVSEASREIAVLVDLVRRSAQGEAGAPSPAEVRRIERAWRRRRAPRLGLAFALAATVSAAGVALLAARRAPPLAYSVEGDVAWADRRVEARGSR